MVQDEQILPYTPICIDCFYSSLNAFITKTTTNKSMKQRFLCLRYIDCFSVSQIKYAQNYIYERKKYGHEENVKKS